MTSLYASDSEIRVRLGLTEEEWRKVLACFCNEPAFKKDVITGKRIWPKIEIFLLNRYGLAKSMEPTDEDGKENWKYG